MSVNVADRSAKPSPPGYAASSSAVQFLSFPTHVVVHLLRPRPARTAGSETPRVGPPPTDRVPRRLHLSRPPRRRRSGSGSIPSIHGGAWSEGGSPRFRFVAAGRRRAAHVVAVPDHRVLPEVEYPVPLGSCCSGRAGASPTRRHMALIVASRRDGGHSADAIMRQCWRSSRPTASRVRSRRAGLSGPYDFSIRSTCRSVSHLPAPRSIRSRPSRSISSLPRPR